LKGEVVAVIEGVAVAMEAPCKPRRCGATLPPPALDGGAVAVTELLAVMVEVPAMLRNGGGTYPDAMEAASEAATPFSIRLSLIAPKFQLTLAFPCGIVSFNH
jgi:hypothetical protein